MVPFAEPRKRRLPGRGAVHGGLPGPAEGAGVRRRAQGCTGRTGRHRRTVQGAARRWRVRARAGRFLPGRPWPGPQGPARPALRADGAAFRTRPRPSAGGSSGTGRIGGPAGAGCLRAYSSGDGDGGGVARRRTPAACSSRAVRRNRMPAAYVPPRHPAVPDPITGAHRPVQGAGPVPPAGPAGTRGDAPRRTGRVSPGRPARRSR
ncbi:hypothetical protein B7R87_21735 [Streptomyces tsukubensis]|nr:hypothetical protein B7R87_21735 [Streptomyces tsukubensis]